MPAEHGGEGRRSHLGAVGAGSGVLEGFIVVPYWMCYRSPVRSREWCETPAPLTTVLNALGGELESQSSFVVAAEVRMRFSGLPVMDRRFDADPTRPVQKAELTTWAGDSKWDLAIRVGASRSPTHRVNLDMGTCAGTCLGHY